MEEFLIDRVPQTWTAPSGFPNSLAAVQLFVQPGRNGLEVAVATATRKPTVADLRAAWAARRNKRAAPVLLIVFYPSPEASGGECVALCGPTGDHPVPHLDVEVSQAERLADVALSEPNHHAATRLLMAALPELDSPFPGLHNSGLLATQELTAGVPLRPDWASARGDAAPLLDKRGRRLIEGLGYKIATLATNASLLTIAGRREAIAVFCDDSEPFEAPSDRFDGMSPVSRALALADRENVDWVVLTRASEIRLYSARPGVGVGRKGRAETYVELNLSLLAAAQAGYLHLLFSATAIARGGSLHEILDDSERFAADLAVRLRERVYHETVPTLAQAVATRLGDNSPAGGISETVLDNAYEQVMVILFRLLFVAYAEDKDLLPYRSNGRYADHSLSRMAQRLADDEHNARTHFDKRATDMWDDVCGLWDAVNQGNADWGVPTYNGGLFSEDPKVSPTGAAIAQLRLTNAEFGPALAAALVDHGPQGLGPVDFRSLSVREFGTIYEGLLESKLSVAPDDLTVKKVKSDLQYVPAGAKDEAVVKAGEVYFHNLSGARKATGSYFTKPFAVEHLLDHALEPALDDHLGRLDTLRDADDDAGVAAAFFDFRCADIAMGSAHFLVAAVDRIEARLSAWLSLHPVPAITVELNRLRNVAMDELGDLGDGVEIETGSLLRRQIARHCVYGVDKNRVAVELARLAIWVHTFVPGLPLSFLDHNLVHGDSLTGVASVEDGALAVRPKGDKSQPSLFVHQLEIMIEAIHEPLARLAALNDADKSEVAAARDAHFATRSAVRPIDDVFDVATAVRAGMIEIHRDFDFTPARIAALADDPVVRSVIERLAPVHYPTTWPEVFARSGRSGFDCLLGNPPWEKVVVDREVWWGMHLPGVRSLPVARRRERIDTLEAQRPDLTGEFESERERAEFLKLILRAAFPHLGTGQTDLYKAFAWANLALCRDGGRLGIVLPRSAVSDAGMANWRQEIVSIDGGGGDKSSASPPQPSSITRVGCSRESTTPTRWCWPRSRATHGRHVPQCPTMDVRRRGRPLHDRHRRGPQAQPGRRTMGVALRPKPTTRT
ncbi:hypothetical protein [Candidatus Poriferisodalis sp.]|uniref:hypothetical protein n=1 Tax=Candidatus Poriferisodalis sp. TaxID=3101277 RepID=UPI003B5BC30C